MSDVLFNGGVPDAATLAQSRGLHYGDGVFRTMLVERGSVVDWPLHWRKLCADAQILGLERPDEATLLGELQQLANAQARCILKLILVRQSAGRGYAPASRVCDRMLLRYDAPAHDVRFWSAGITAIRADMTLAAQPALAGIKHLNRLEQVLASRSWPAGVQEAIVCNARGEPISGTRSNLFWASRGVLHTPDLGECGVAGMMRGKLIDLAASRGIKIRIGNTPWQSLEEADEVFVCNSIIGLWPVRQLEKRVWNAPGVLTRQCLNALAHPGVGTC